MVVLLDLGVMQNRILPELATRHFAAPQGLEYKLAIVDADNAPNIIYASDPGFRVNDVERFDSVMNVFSSSSFNLKKREGALTAKDSRNLPDHDWRNFTAAGWFPVIQYDAADQPWLFVVQHRTQPVSAIGRSVWQRNLLAGGVVLVLLATNIAMVLFGSFRARKLATAQMEFVASVSHELLTPLSAIYCSGQNAKDGLLQTGTELVAHGSIITSQTRQLIDLVKQNLLFAATNNDSNRFTLRPLQIAQILECVHANIAALIEESGAVIEYDVHPSLPGVMGDLAGIAQCLQNLIGNAIKYGGRNGLIRVSASLHGEPNDSSEVSISVADRGPGIGRAELRHIFEPFYRSPKVIEAQIHGTGLGLTVAARIAEAMGGKISVTSRVGLGSTFTLHLPALKAVAEMPARLPEGL